MTTKQRSMSAEWEICLKNKRIVPSNDAKRLTGKEVSEALLDLEAAQKMFDEDMHKYATVTAYYAMFHAARALLYSQGYRERGHACLVVAIEKLFGKTGLMEMRLVRALDHGMNLREDADYASEYTQEGAEKILKDAKEFIQKAQEMLTS